MYYGQRFRKLLYLLKTSAMCVLLLGPLRSQKDLLSSLFLINPFFKALSNIWGLYVMSTFFLCKELQKFVYSVIWSIHIMANYIFMWALLIFPTKILPRNAFLLHTNNNLIFGRKYFFFALIISVLLVSQTGLSNLFLQHSRLSEFIFYFKDF